MGWVFTFPVIVRCGWTTSSRSAACRVRFPIGPAKFSQIARDTFLELLHTRFKLPVGEVLVTVVDRFEFAAIDRNNRLREQIEAAA
jgi:hypothetical protein